MPFFVNSNKFAFVNYGENMKKFKRKNPKTITDLKHLVKSSFEKYGDKTLYEYKVSNEVEKYTYTSLYNDMNALGTAFVSRGLTQKNIAVIGETSVNWTLTYLSTVNSNSTIVPLDRELSIDSICDFLNHAQCVAIAYSKSFNGKLTALADKLTTVKLFIRFDPDTDNTDIVNDPTCETVDFCDLINEGRKLLNCGNTSFTDIVPDIEKCCAILFTSGTTGTSKGVMLSQKNLTAAINSASWCVPYDDTTTLVSVLPIHHTYEFTCTHLSGINIGCSIFINPSLKYAARSMQYYKPNALIVVPMFLETVYKKVWGKINDENMASKVKKGMKFARVALKLGIDIRKNFFSDILAAFGGNVKSIVSGAAPIKPEILKDFYAFGISVFEGYGITECAPLVSVNPYQKPKFGSVGTPVRGIQVKIDPQTTDGSEKGEILVKGDNVMLGYYNNPQATANAFTEDGWFKTGDIGYIDRAGYIYITGRKKNIILLSNGKNVYPEELEENFASCEYVKEIVVVGRHDEDKSETSIVAIVYPDYDSFSEFSHEELCALTRESLSALNLEMPSFKQVTDFEFRECEFEKTTTKKIKRFLVK